ncbi:MAG: hypothetical protein IJT14_04025 [Rickettsiales bacterium]|nr:hypothetical protein [Rickettsiales bacterium]
MQENSEENPGEKFLEKQDEKYKKLLVELNEEIGEWKKLDGKINKTDEDEKALEKKLKILQNLSVTIIGLLLRVYNKECDRVY